MDSAKQTFLSYLEAPIPDLTFLQNAENLALFPELLESLLEEEKALFYEKLEGQDGDINFEIFEDDSKLGYLFSILHHIDNINSSEKSRKIIKDFEPKYTDFGNEVSYSKRYYEMLKICLKRKELSNDQKKILNDAVKLYEVRGIHLDPEKQNRLKEIQTDLSNLSRRFSENALLSEEELEIFIENEDEIQEMPEDQKSQALKKAQVLGKTGYQFGSSISEYISLMKYCSSKHLRKKIYLERSMVASFGEHDNRKIVLDILKLRQEKAMILGFKDYNDFSLYFKMADSAEEVQDILKKIGNEAKKKARKEQKQLQEYFSLDILDAEDTAFYFRKYKEQKFKLHENELRQYFEYDSVLSQMFEIMSELYDLTIKKNTDQSSSDYSCYEIYRKDILLSYFIVDPFFRPEKRSGAWANILKEKYKGSIPVIINVYNINKGEDVTLLKLHEVETLFHEFGHAMHEMFSISEYSELSGFHVERDFVELPSQFHEHFCNSPEGLRRVGVHYQTGQKMPESLIDRLQEIDRIEMGNTTLGQCVYAGLDMLLHGKEIPDSLEELDEHILNYVNELSLYKKPKEYKMYCSFSHIFDGGYAAGYYSYMWAEILELDVWSEFKKHGIFNTEISQKFYDNVLSQGSRKSGKDLFKDFCGREMSLKGFFEAKGL